MAIVRLWGPWRAFYDVLKQERWKVAHSEVLSYHARRMLFESSRVCSDHEKSNGRLFGHSCDYLGKNVDAGHGTICSVITCELISRMSQQPLLTRA